MQFRDVKIAIFKPNRNKFILIFSTIYDKLAMTASSLTIYNKERNSYFLKMFSLLTYLKDKKEGRDGKREQDMREDKKKKSAFLFTASLSKIREPEIQSSFPREVALTLRVELLIFFFFFFR